jgi:hypothetical protein
VPRNVKTQTVQLAARLLGSPRKLRDFLGAPSANVASWLAGEKDPPESVFLRCLELILDRLDGD